MDASLIAVLAALVGVVASSSFLRQSLRARQVRLRLDYAREGDADQPLRGALGLAEPPVAPDGGGKARVQDSGIREPVDPPLFVLCERRTGRMAPALMASMGFHAAIVAAGPEALLWVSRALEAEQRLVVRFDNVIRMPLTLRLPDARRVVMAPRESPARGLRAGARPAAAPRPRSLMEPAIPKLGDRVESLPSPALPSAAAQIDAPRPQRAYRTVPATTLLQPRRPEARQEVVELPAFAAWSGKAPELPSPQMAPGSSLPGMLAAAPPPRRPVLPFPSGLPVPAAVPSVEEPKLALPPPGVPVDSPPPGGPVLGSGILTPGEPVSVISVSLVPLPPGQAVQIPPVTQAGGGVEEGGDGGAGSRSGGAGGAGGGLSGGDARASGGRATAAGSPEGIAGGAGATGGGVPGGRGSAAAGAGTAAGTGPGARGNGAGAGNATGGGAGMSAAGSGAGAGLPGAAGGSGNARSGSPYVRELRLGGQRVKMEQRPDGTVVLIFPSDGNFDVVVVESAFPETLSDLAKRLSGRPVYTAYLDLGAGPEWTLHYCAVEKREEAAQNSMVVTLEDPPPLRAPYIQRAELPAQEEWKSSRYQAFHGYITAQGRLERVTAVRAGRNPESLLKLLPQWEFRPAARGGKAVEIEVLIVVPPDRAP